MTSTSFCGEGHHSALNSEYVCSVGEGVCCLPRMLTRTHASLKDSPELRASLIAQLVKKLQCRRPGSGRSPREGHGNPLQYSCLENPMDRGAWWATVHGAARVGHDLATQPPPLPVRHSRPINSLLIYHINLWVRSEFAFM